MTRARDIANFGDGIATADIGDGQITTAKIADGDVTAAKLFSGFANGITEVDLWYLTTGISATTGAAFITTNLARADGLSEGFAKIGTGMSESSGVFTFPSTGLYRIDYNVFFTLDGSNTYVGPRTHVTFNNSTYAQVNAAYNNGDSVNDHCTAHCSCIINVTDTANVKVKFSYEGQGTYDVIGGTNLETCMQFIRLGDAQ